MTDGDPADSAAASRGFETGWLEGGGETGALIRSIDWSRSPLGPPAQWPQSLRTAVGICLASRFPILIWWGPSLVMLYNDAYRVMLGDKHPRSMGQPGRECWAEIWHIIGPMLEGVMERGEATWSDNQMLPLRRRGFTEECYFTFTYSPIRVERGRVGGVFCAVVQTTDGVLSSRRMTALRDLAARAGSAPDERTAARVAVETLHLDTTDVPFALIYLLNDDGAVELAAAAGVETDAPTPLGVTTRPPGSGDLEAAVLRVAAGEPAADILQLPDDLRVSPSTWPEPPARAVALPIARPGQERPYGVLVAGVSPRRPLDEPYRGFFVLSAGHIANAIASARAHDEERRRAAALAELDRAKTAFFSNVSHEFRMPLTLMLGPIEELMRAEPSGSEARALLDVVRRNGMRLEKLVNTLLDFSRLEAGRVEPVYEATDLAALTADVAGNFRSACERAGLTLEIECPPLPEAVYVDRDMWEKIVLNLLSNAFRFTFAGGIAVRLRPVAGAVELVVRDSGIGIAAAELAHIFERFHRVRDARARTHEGTGIGLSLVQELTRLHGGSVGVQSAPGLGTAFTVTFPTGRSHLPPDRIGAPRALEPTSIAPSAFVEEAARGLGTTRWSIEPSEGGVDAARPVAPAAPGAPRPRILWADDNADMRHYVRRLLSPSYEVVEAGDGRAALAAATARPPDLVLADVMMPGLDGFGLLRQLRARPETARVPVILVSARAGEESRLEGIEAGADDYLVKPFSARELIARIAARLEIVRVRDAADRRIRESEERLRVALDASRFGTWEYTIATAAVTASDRCQSQLGLQPGEAATLERLKTALHPDDLESMRQAVLRAIQAMGDFETECRCLWPGGEIRWIDVRGRVLADDHGRPGRIVGVTLDVTGRKSAEDRIASDLQTMTLLQHVGDVCARADCALEECLETVLDAALRITGTHMGNIQLLDEASRTLRITVQRGFSAPFLAFFETVDAEDAAACGAAFAGGVRVIVPDVRESAIFAGQPSQQVLLDAGVAAVQSSPLVASTGQVLGMLSTHCSQPHVPDDRVLRSLDLLARQAAGFLERQHAEQALREADRRKDEFLATLAHELRNPLAPVRTGIQLLRHQQIDDRQARRVTGMMERQVDHMVRLVDDLLEASRITSGKIQLRKELVELSDVVHNAIETVGPALESAGHALDLELPGEPVWMEGDPVRLAQVVANLLNNAVKYTDAGGTITIAASSDGQWISLTVRDTGAGIPADMLPHVFDLFTQVDRTLGRAQGGLGIGLALVRHLVRMHGGDVDARSGGPGEGSEFLVRLPAAAPPLAPDAAHRPAAAVRAGGAMRCLVVDDNRDAADSLALLLQQCLGAVVETAYGGGSALEAIRRSVPSVVFLDLGMPGLDGFAVASAVRAVPEWRDIRLIAITGWGQQEDRRRTTAAGFDGHLVKPVALDAVTTLLDTLQVSIDR
jgi:PAS domain S-box-containing protein